MRILLGVVLCLVTLLFGSALHGRQQEFDQLVFAWSFGGNTRQPDSHLIRAMGWGMAYPEQGGWDRFFERQVDPVVDWCRRNRVQCRLLFHNPAGRTYGCDGIIDKMTFLQFSDAFNEGQYHIVDGFVENLAARRGQVKQAIVYLGAPHNTPRFMSAPNWAQQRLVMESKLSEIVFRAGADLAIDNTATQPSDSLTHQLVESWSHLGIEVYGEATPEYKFSHWREYPAIVTYPHFRRRHMEPQHPAAVGRWPIWNADDWYTEETIAWVRGADAGGLGNPSQIKAIVELLDGGATVGVAPQSIDLSRGMEQFGR